MRITATQKNIWWSMLGVCLGIFVIVWIGIISFQSISFHQKANVPLVTTKTIQTNDGVSNVDITYPYIHGIDSTINEKIKTIVDTRIQTFRETVSENERARIETNTQLSQNEQRPAQPRDGEYWYSLFVRYATGTITDTHISVMFFIDEYVGGAHGNKSYEAFNYDVLNHKEITLTDLFVHEPNYLERISRYAYENITKQLETRAPDLSIDTEWVHTGTAPIQENFSNFILVDDGVLFYIPPYQVAAYVYGDFQFTIPTVQ